VSRKIAQKKTFFCYMKVPLSWLKEYVPTKCTPQKIADILTVIGLEVEGIHDSILEVALTPNLSHCASIRGIAREFAAVTQEPLHLPKFTVTEKNDIFIQQQTSVTIENPRACPRYACRSIIGVRVTPSPDWLKERIEQCGMRSINNVVDITNLVLLEFGHPLHAFDLDRLEERRIIVRNAKKNEAITAIDGKEYYPAEETLLICDAKKPIAIAGIIGSSDTEVTESTHTLLLESAYFEPSQVRKASKRLGIRSEASYRFERGTDPNGVIEALDRAVSLICEATGGVAVKGVLDVKTKEFVPSLISCRLSRINRVLGIHLAMNEVEIIYQRLRFEVSDVKEDLITVKVPTYRNDISQEIDLIEEIARFYEYGNIHKKEQAFYRTGTLSHSPEYLFAKKIRSRMIAEGLQEFLTCDLIGPDQAALVSTDNFPSRTLVKLLNPRSIERSVMRPSMLPGMLSTIKYNADHDIYSVAGFEVGRVHFTSKERYFEPSVLSVVLTGERIPPHWEKKEGKIDFFDLKGIVENLFEAFKIPVFFSPSTYTNFHPGRQAKIRIAHIDAGIMGEIHPRTLQTAGLEHPVYFAELNLEDMLPFIQPNIKMKLLPQFPASSRDWTITVSNNISAGCIFSWIEQEHSELLESFSLLDVYRSDKLGSNRKNVTFRFVYRDRSKTISLSAVENEHLRITKNIAEHLNEESS